MRITKFVKYTFLYLFIFLVAVACSKVKELSQEEKPPVTNRVSRGIYVDDFDKILGTESKEKALLTWCANHSFNDLALYGMERILAEFERYASLKKFVHTARKEYPNLKINFVAGGDKCVQKIHDYSHLYTDGVPDGVVTEYEFWNPDFPFHGFQKMLNEMTLFKQEEGVATKRIVYVSHFRDYEKKVTSEEILKTLLSATDELWVVNYSPKAYAYPLSVHEKLQTLANSAFEHGTQMPIRILYNVMENAYDPNIFHYVDVKQGNHSFMQIFDAFKHSFDTASIVHKESLQLSGYQFFRYSDAAKARP